MNEPACRFGKLNKQTTDENYRYAFQGQEKDPETGMEAFELRLWDGRLGRWLTVDPKGQYFSPYLGMGNNPISRIDPDGGFDGDNPIYGSDGKFRGVDEFGLSGEAIIYDGEFQNGMSQSEILTNGGMFLSDYASRFAGYLQYMDDPTWKQVFSHSYDLKKRPDYDGFLTLDEANSWARSAASLSTAEKSLYVDIGKIDLGSLTMYDFTKPTIQVNFADPRSARMVGSTGAVYGTITLTLLNQKGDLRIGRKKDNLVDIYDFNMDGRWMRDKLTKLGIYIATVNGKYKITGFNIYGYGKAKIPNMR